MNNILLSDNLRLNLVDKNFLITDQVVIDLEAIFSQKGCVGLFGEKAMDRQTISNYLEWAKDMNKSGDLYLFLVRNEHGSTLGGLDIQRGSTTDASIGFWKDEESDISMTRCVFELLAVCKEMGFEVVSAYIEVVNKKAESLLERATFARIGSVEGRTKSLIKYEKKLF